MYEILASYHVRVKQETEYSGIKKIQSGFSPGSVLGPVMYLLYRRDLPEPERATVAEFADFNRVKQQRRIDQKLAEKIEDSAE